MSPTVVTVLLITWPVCAAGLVVWTATECVSIVRRDELYQLVAIAVASLAVLPSVALAIEISIEWLLPHLRYQTIENVWDLGTMVPAMLSIPLGPFLFVGGLVAYRKSGRTGHLVPLLIGQVAFWLMSNVVMLGVMAAAI